MITQARNLLGRVSVVERGRLVLMVLAYLWHVVFFAILPWAGLVCLVGFVHASVSARRSRRALARLTELVPPAPAAHLEPDYRAGALPSLPSVPPLPAPSQSEWSHSLPM